MTRPASPRTARQGLDRDDAFADSTAVLDQEPANALAGVDRFRALVLEGLARPDKRLPTEFFYDERGSALFDAICDLPEYYVTRTELALMAEYAGAMADAVGPGASIIELGSGSSTKSRLLLDALDRPRSYVPVDISREHLEATAVGLRRQYPAIEILPVAGDFMRPLPLPAVPAPRVVYFPGSTIGNFERPRAIALLESMRQMAGPGGAVLIGIDLMKSPTILEPAYDDAAGVTAEFNLNLLHRINRELGADFEPMRFRHRAFVDDAQSRVVMTLVSTCAQIVTVAGQRFRFRDGESIVTEYSHKYRPHDFALMARAAGLRVDRAWTDERQWFAVELLRPA
jgi:L-histidine N-alpha-methyltransferase